MSAVASVTTLAVTGNDGVSGLPGLLAWELDAAFELLGLPTPANPGEMSALLADLELHHQALVVVRIKGRLAAFTFPAQVGPRQRCRSLDMLRPRGASSSAMASVYNDSDRPRALPFLTVVLAGA